jgi:hypothetical protein
VLGEDRQTAWRSLKAMFARGVRQRDGGKQMDEGGVLPFTTSWLYGQLATLYEGRVMLDQGVPLRDLASRVGVRQFADRFVAQVRQHDLGRLRQGLLALHACQRRSRLTGEDPELLLERFLVEWFGHVPAPTGAELEL